MWNLDSLCDEINQQWNDDLDLYIAAVCNRFDMMILEAEHGKSKSYQGEELRVEGRKGTLAVLAGREPQPETVSGDGWEGFRQYGTTVHPGEAS